MGKIIYSFIAIVSPFLLSYCQSKTQTNEKWSTDDQFADYWYTGVAEINTYSLEQARYGEIHKGKAVLIFVTEPFSKSKQVKLDYPKQSGKDKQTVLKLNFTKKFTTGIYPYSMMLSVFTPVNTENAPHTPKVTMSSQEWCGHVFSQLNLENSQYKVQSFSYFEQEGDTEEEIEVSFLEDELWNKIRLDHKSLPVGAIEVIPGLFDTRLRHKELIPQAARATITSDDGVKTYRLEYVKSQRVLAITFKETFPFQVLSWEEQIPAPDGGFLSTKAELDRTLNTDYWNKNNVSDAHLRDSLGLK